MKYLLALFFAAFFCANFAFAENDSFYFDAVCFKGDSGKPCVDIALMAPFQSLRFKPKNDFYYSKYNITITVYDSAGASAKQENISRTIKSQSYFESIGGDSKFDAIQKRIYLPQGKYQIKIFLKMNSMALHTRNQKDKYC